MPVFYTSQIDQNQAILGEEESRHIVKVLRMAGGDTLEMVDGKGNYYSGTITAADPKACLCAGIIICISPWPLLKVQNVLNGF